MNTKTRDIIAIACCALFAFAGCYKKNKGSRSDVRAGNGDRSVHAIVDGLVFVEPQPDKLIVTAKDHEIVIEKERLLVDKKESGKVPEAAKQFEVFIAGDAVTVSADGVEIFRSEAEK